MEEMNARKMTRRAFVTQGVCAAACLPLMTTDPTQKARQKARPAQPQEKQGPFTPLSGQLPFSPEDDAFLEELEKRSFAFFWDQANPDTGIVCDRHNVVTNAKNPLGSIAAMGFGLTGLCIGEKRGFGTHYEIRGRILNTLRFLWKKLPNHRGFFYHWANVDTGERLWDSEVSSIDTAILLCGILTARQHFPRTEISELA